MLIDYANPEQYFKGKPSISVVMVGKTKRKLKPINVSIWPTMHKKEDAEIDGKVKLILCAYIAVELTGEVEDKQIIEGFSDLEAFSGMLSYIQSMFLKYQEQTGHKFFINNYAGEEWCRVDIDEMFHGLVFDDD